MSNFPNGQIDGENKEVLAQLLCANIKDGNYESDDPRVQAELGIQIQCVAKKTLFLIGYNEGWKWIHKQEDKFYKNINLIDDIADEVKRTTPKEGNGKGTWQLGFCAGVISYLNGYIQQKERIKKLCQTELK